MIQLFPTLIDFVEEDWTATPILPQIPSFIPLWFLLWFRWTSMELNKIQTIKIEDLASITGKFNANTYCYIYIYSLILYWFSLEPYLFTSRTSGKIVVKLLQQLKIEVLKILSCKNKNWKEYSVIHFRDNQYSKPSKNKYHLTIKRLAFVCVGRIPFSTFTA